MFYSGHQDTMIQIFSSTVSIHACQLATAELFRAGGGDEMSTALSGNGGCPDSRFICMARVTHCLEHCSWNLQLC